MKPTKDGLSKVVRAVMIATGIFFTIIAFTITCTPKAHADHTGPTPQVEVVPSPVGPKIVIDARAYRGDQCALWTTSPDVGSVFYNYVAGHLAPREFVYAMTLALAATGDMTKEQAKAFAEEGLKLCNTES